MPNKAASWCSETLGYGFADPALLTEALTHGSSGQKPTYERLEFLGDRVLGLAVAELLFQSFPNANEGELGRRHAILVQGVTLSKVADTWDILPHVRQVNGTLPPSAGVLADVVEAVLGAVYIDGGWQAAQAIVHQTWQPLLDESGGVDAKTALQEKLQALHQPLPNYTVVDTQGPEHLREFTVEVECALGIASGKGPSKQAATMAAAGALLAMLEKTA